MHATPLLTIVALVETGTAVVLIVWPALVLTLLFGWRLPPPEALVMGRVAGAGALSVGVVSWVAAWEANRPPLAVLAGVLTYNAVSAAVLALAGAVLGMAGVLLWPAAAYHVALTGWGAACLCRTPGAVPR